MANLSSLRKFMDNFMQNLLQMGMSIEQARIQAKIWLDNQMKEYAQSLENQKTMEQIRTENELGVLGARTAATEGLAKTAYQRDLTGKFFDPRYYEKLPQGNLQALSALKNVLPEEGWRETGFVFPPDTEQKISESVKAGTLGADDLQNLRKTDPNTLTTIIRTLGFDRAMELVKGRASGIQTMAQQGLTTAGQGLEQKRIDLGWAQLKGQEEGKGGKLSDADKERIDQIDAAQTFIVSQEYKWNKWDELKPSFQLLHPELKPLDPELQGAVLQYSEGIKNDILNGNPIKPSQIKFLNIMKNAPALNKLGTLTLVLESFLTPPSTAEPSAIPTAPVVVSQPLAKPTYKYTATNPTTGQVAGSNDGLTWYDIRTGQIIK